MRKIRNPIALAFIYLALISYAIFSVAPVLWTALQSFKTPRQANSRTPLIIFEPTLDNYTELWLKSVPENAGTIALILVAIVGVLVVVGINAGRISGSNATIYFALVLVGVFVLWNIPRYLDTAEFYDFFLNTIIVTVGTVSISMTIGCLAGYALARYSGLSGVVILVAALGFRSLPSLAFVLPYFFLGTRTGLIDQYPLLIITMVAMNQPFTIWMLRSFFMDIPKEIEESAMVDGANRLTAFRKVIIPLMWPGIVSTGLFSVLLAYSEFLLVRILTRSNWTLSVAIAQFTGGEDPGHLTLAAAAAISATLPIVLLILFFQKQLLAGLTAGAVKG
jgi:multiple sugar transport system permease protein